MVRFDNSNLVPKRELGNQIKLPYFRNSGIDSPQVSWR